ncbi:unnamed protein product [Amoebophrya sp. A120]|nr:unnamed protein product [Amoebophrya sp. A120]|eukprot:GSA120T00023871001.1
MHADSNICFRFRVQGFLYGQCGASVNALVVSAHCYNTRRDPQRITTGAHTRIPIPASRGAQLKKEGHDEFGLSRKKGRLLPLVCPR